MSDSELLKVLQRAERRGRGSHDLLSNFGLRLAQRPDFLALCQTSDEYWRRFGQTLWKWVVMDHKKKPRRTEQLDKDANVYARTEEEPFNYEAARDKLQTLLPTLPPKQRAAIIQRLNGERMTAADMMNLTRAIRRLRCFTECK